MNINVTHKAIDVEAAVELWSRDLPASSIAAELGVTRNALLGFVYRNRDIFPSRPPRNSKATIVTDGENRRTSPRNPKVNYEKASEMWKAGATKVAIAECFHVTTKTIWGIAKYNPDLFPHRLTTTPQRNKVDVDLAEKLWKQGVSARQIGERFGVSHSIIHSLAASLRDRFPARTEVSWSRPSTPKQRVNRVKMDAEAFAADPSIFQRPTNYDLERGIFAKTLDDLADNECHWPINDGGPFMFCSAANRKGSRYCTHHSMRAKGERG